MKTFLIIILTLSINFTYVVAAEKKNCSGIKKISKEYMSCKAGNILKSTKNVGGKLKKGTTNKVGKLKKSISKTFKKKDK